VHDHECDGGYSRNVDEEESIVEETLLKESREEIEHEVPPSCLEFIEYTSLIPWT